MFNISSLPIAAAHSISHFAQAAKRGSFPQHIGYALAIIGSLGAIWLLKPSKKPAVEPLTENEIALLLRDDAFKIYAGNKAINDRIRKTLESADLPAKTKVALQRLSKFIFEVGDFDEAKNALKCAQDNLTGKNEATITPRQLRRLQRISEFESWTREADTPLDGDCRQLILDAHAFCQSLRTELEKDPEWNVTGDFLADTLDIDGYIIGDRARPLVERLAYAWAQGTVTHAALTMDDGQERQISHMWGRPSNHSIAPLDLGYYGSTRVRINWEQVIPQSLQTGADWKTVIQNKYAAIVREWHTTREVNAEGQTCIDGKVLTNPLSKRIIVATRWLFKWHLFKRNWRDQADFQADWFKSAHQVSCGEFSMRVTLLCLRRLELELNDKQAADFKRPEGEYWKQEGYTPLNLDINPHLRLQRLSPINMLYRGTQNKSLGVQIQSPEVYRRLVAASK